MTESLYPKHGNSPRSETPEVTPPALRVRVAVYDGDRRVDTYEAHLVTFEPVWNITARMPG